MAGIPLPPWASFSAALSPRSLKNRLALLTVGLAIVFIWAMVLGSIGILQGQFEKILSDQQQAAVRYVAADIDGKIRMRVEGLSRLAPGVAAILHRSPDDVAAYLSTQPSLRDFFSGGMAVIKLDGHTFSDYPKASGRRGTYYGDRDYFRRVIETHRPYVDKPIMGRALKRPVLTIAVPIFDTTGKVRGVLTGISDLTGPNFLGVIADRAVTGSAEFFVFSPRDEIVVAATNTELVMTKPSAGNPAYDLFAAGFEGSSIGVNSHGIAKLYSAKRVPTADWFVMAGLPTDVAFKPVHTMQQFMFLLGTVLTIVALFAARRMSARALAPLADASEAMRRMMHRELPLAPLPSGGKDEIGELIGSFNLLVEDRQRYESALAESEQRFRMLVESAPDAIFVQTGGRFAYVNDATLGLFGAQHEEDLLGQPVLDRVAPSARPSVEQRLSDLARTGRMATAQEETHIRLDGSPIDLEVSGVPFRYGDEDGSLVFARDVSERKKAAEQLSKLWMAVDQSPNGVVITDLNARIEYVNEAAVKSSGYSRSELLGRNPSLLQSGQTPPEIFRSLWATLAKEESWSGEFINRRKSGQFYYEYERISPVRQPDGRITHYLAVKEDITERKKMETELDNYREHLEHIVDSRTREVEELNRQLERRAADAESATQAKSRFLANMSHEIRTPISVIMGFAGLAQRDAHDEKQCDYLAKITEASRHLLQIINDVLDFSKIEAGKLAIANTTFTLDEVFANVDTLIAERARSKGLTFEKKLAPHIAKLPLIGDPLRLGQILINYCGNAVKFTERGGVVLSAEATDESPAEIAIRFEVADTGMGIGFADQARLFAAFEQGDDSTTRRFGGSGLGLAISRHLAALMGGTVGVESDPGHGSRFWLSLRLSKASAPQNEAAAPADELADDALEQLRRRHTGKRVLVVEDEPLNQQIVQEILDGTGLVVNVADSGTAAVEEARHGAYDLILMDVQMPVMDGLAATAAIRSQEGARIPIVAMTANAFSEDRQRCIEAGMDDYIAKPCYPEDLFAILLKWLPASRPTD